MILDDIVAKTRLALEHKSLELPLSTLERQALHAPEPRDFLRALSSRDLSVIAEIKRASPSQGVISSEFNYRNIAAAYEAGGASALSVLTERYFFQGDTRHLTDIKKLVSIPVLRKDFIISEYQIVETRALGGDALLLIAAILDDMTMRKLYELAADYGLHCLFEANDEKEVKRVLDCGARIVGINNRDLKTFQIDLRTFENLHKHIPADVLAVAESGITTAEDARRMRDAGADAILVGTALMQAGDPAEFIRQV